MTSKRLLIIACCMGLFFGSTESAFAFCGVIVKTDTAKSASKALKRARKQVRNEIKVLQQEHGDNLQLDQAQETCVGGGVSIDADGNQITGRPSCTVTQSFCVNPEVQTQ